MRGELSKDSTSGRQNRHLAKRVAEESLEKLEKLYQVAVGRSPSREAVRRQGFYSFFSILAVNVPWASRAEISSPGSIWAELFTSFPEESKTSAYPRSRIATGESTLN